MKSLKKAEEVKDERSRLASHDSMGTCVLQDQLRLERMRWKKLMVLGSEILNDCEHFCKLLTL